MNGLIRLKSVEIENFLSINSASYDFQNRGLVGVFGPTGVGKSALFVESLTMGTFGISERYGKSRDMVVNRFIGQDCYIGLNYDVDGNDVEIKTYRKHSKFKNEVFFTVNGEDRRGNSHDQTREKIARYLDMDYLSFTNSIVFGQGVAKYFSSMGDSDQKMIAERLLGITWIPRAYELVGNDVDLKLQEFTKYESILTGLHTKMCVLENEVKGLEKQRDDFVMDIEKLVKQVEIEISDIYSQIKDVGKIKFRIEEINVLLKDLEIKNSFDLISNMGSLKTKIKIIKDKILNGNETLVELNALFLNKSRSKEEICPYCNQTVSSEHWEDYLKHLSKDRDSLQHEVDLLDIERENLDVSIKDCDKKFKEIQRKEEEIKKLTVECNLLEKELASIDKENELLKERVLALGDKIDELRVRENPYINLVKDTTDKIKVFQDEADQVSVEQEKIKDDLKYLKFWQEGFSNRGLKSYIIESVIPSMNESAKIYSKLLEDKYDITFSPTRSLKKGDLREKFNIEVNNRFGSELYEGNSNGERRTIDIIVMFVLGDLAAKRCSKRFSILVLDDVFEKIDESICENVMSVLRMLTLDPFLREEEFRQLPQRESIFVLTHLEYFKNKFENQMIVENSNGQTKYREN